MNFDQFVSEYIAEDHDVEQLSVMVLEGCRARYPLAAEAEKQKLQEVMEKAARAAADAHRFGRYGFFLYDQTGKEMQSGLRTARSPKTAYSDVWKILPGRYPAV